MFVEQPSVTDACHSALQILYSLHVLYTLQDDNSVVPQLENQF